MTVTNRSLVLLFKWNPKNSKRNHTRDCHLLDPRWNELFKLIDRRVVQNPFEYGTRVLK